MTELECIEHSRVGGVSLSQVDEGYGPHFVVMDDDFHYRIRIFPFPASRELAVEIAAEWSDDAPGKVANFTPAYEHSSSYCAFEEISISDNGLLSVMARRKSASHVLIHHGWTAQLPTKFVAPLRQGIALAELLLESRV